MQFSGLLYEIIFLRDGLPFEGPENAQLATAFQSYAAAFSSNIKNDNLFKVKFYRSRKLIW